MDEFVKVSPQADQGRLLWFLIGAYGELFEDRVPQGPTSFFSFSAFYPLYSIFFC